jgi:ssDNA-binding protein
MNRQLITPLLVLGYHSLIKPAPSKYDPTKLKYYASGLITGASMETAAFKKIMAAIDEFRRERFGSNVSSKFNHAVRRDLDRSKGYPNEIVAFVNCSALADHKPKLVDRDLQDILDPAAELYPGCLVRLSVKLRAYGDRPGDSNRGIAIDLINLQKWDDGPRLAIGRGDGSEFGNLDGDDDIMS